MGEIYRNQTDMPKDEHRISVQLYYGFGNVNDFFIVGHVLKSRSSRSFRPSRNLFRHSYRMARMYLGKPHPNHKISLLFEGIQMEVQADEDGYFQCVGKTVNRISTGWRPVFVNQTSQPDSAEKIPAGWVFIPQESPFLIVSDVDDTVLISHSLRFRKRMRELILKNTYKRRLFAEATELYGFLEDFLTLPGQRNPVFYVSASEWNLFPYLREIFEKNGLPKGPILLHPRKHWSDLWGGKKTLPMDKQGRIERLMTFFPDRKVILLGDNSQQDPIIYQNLSEKEPERIAGVFIRLVSEKKVETTRHVLQKLSELGIPNGLFVHSPDAIDQIRQSLKPTRH